MFSIKSTESCWGEVPDDLYELWRKDRETREEREMILDLINSPEQAGESSECSCGPINQGIRWSDVLSGDGPYPPLTDRADSYGWDM